MPCDYSKYPKNWKTISQQIRTERAFSACECSGDCGYDHASEAVVDSRDKDVYAAIGIDIQGGRCGALNGGNSPVTGSKVVLTVAHLCSCVPLCANPEHLKALCQRCHNKLDAPMRRKNAAKTRRNRKDAERLLFA